MICLVAFGARKPWWNVLFVMAFRPVRVYGATLDPKKTWILVTEELCGCRPRDFAKNSLFIEFPQEVHHIPRTSLTEWREGTQRPLVIDKVLKQPPNVYVCSPFGLFAGMLRLRSMPSNGFRESAMMNRAIDVLNNLDVFGAELQQQRPQKQQQQQTSKLTVEKESDPIDDLESDELNNLKLKISKLVEELRRFENISSESNLDDPRSIPLKKRAAAQRPRQIFTNLNDVCNK